MHIKCLKNQSTDLKIQITVSEVYGFRDLVHTFHCIMATVVPLVVSEVSANPWQVKKESSRDSSRRLPVEIPIMEWLVLEGSSGGPGGHLVQLLAEAGPYRGWGPHPNSFLVSPVVKTLQPLRATWSCFIWYLLELMVISLYSYFILLWHASCVKIKIFSFFFFSLFST